MKRRFKIMSGLEPIPELAPGEFKLMCSCLEEDGSTINYYLFRPHEFPASVEISFQIV